MQEEFKFVSIRVVYVQSNMKRSCHVSPTLKNNLLIMYLIKRLSLVVILVVNKYT